jgi:hypothetical protein
MMNVSPSPQAAPSATETKAPDAQRGTQPRSAQDHQQQRDRFERLLRDKQGEQGDECETQPEAPLGGLLPLGNHVLHAARLPEPRPAAGLVDAASTGPRAAIEAALNTNAPEHVSPIGGAEPAAVWEASINEVNSVPVELKMARAERIDNEARSDWTLTVGSSNVNAEVLARHASRLNERLRKRGVGLDHVRIQRDEGEA